MPLDLLGLSTQVREMGELLARRRGEEAHRLELLAPCENEVVRPWAFWRYDAGGKKGS